MTVKSKVSPVVTTRPSTSCFTTVIEPVRTLVAVQATGVTVLPGVGCTWIPAVPGTGEPPQAIWPVRNGEVPGFGVSVIV